jgi:hypothetical protein
VGEGGQLLLQVIEPIRGHGDAGMADYPEGVDGGHRLGEADAETRVAVGGEGGPPVGKG